MKGIPYRTEWVEYPDIADTLKKLGAEPSSMVNGDTPVYTVPTIYDPNTHRVVTDSTAIAYYLDEQYPQAPHLFPPGTRALQAALTKHLETQLYCTFPLAILRAWELTTPKSKPYIRATREAFLGCALEDAMPPPEKRAELLKTVEVVLDQAAEFIRANGEGALFFGGEQPIYADLFLAGSMAATETLVGKDGELLQAALKASDGHWAKFMDYFEQYRTVQ
jgi:glutathione S-transferase